MIRDAGPIAVSYLNGRVRIARIVTGDDGRVVDFVEEVSPERAVDLAWSMLKAAAAVGR